jgi:MYXO-CTERM domain-containing protein
MVIVDTSGSMDDAVPPPANSCGFPTNDRIAHARCAVKNAVTAYAGEVNFGLATFAWRENCTDATCGVNDCYSGCTAQLPPGDNNNCGPFVTETSLGATVHAGAMVPVPLLQDHYWSDPPSPSNVAQILGLVDNTCCSSNGEIGTNSNTPLGGSLYNMNQYFSGLFKDPFTSGTVPSPLGTAAQGERPCRSVNIIFITDGDETCDAGVNPTPIAGGCRAGFASYLNAAGERLASYEADRLFVQGVTYGGQNFKVKTHVIGFAGASINALDNIAACGGTGSSYSTDNETELSQALSSIVAGSIQPEVCDNTDNNCNGCTDEGSTHYCDVQQTCCAWATQAQRTVCLDQYKATISAANPDGDATKLPCTTAQQQTDPLTWLCYDPDDLCDGVDNNCDGQIDEGQLKCGNPPHCPMVETCNGVDDDCDGSTDEGCATQCVPSAEICDGCDNDCDGTIDDGITPLPCGLADPPNCTGTLTCKPSQPAASPGACIPGGGFNPCSNNPQPEICDGIDNDCDGIKDDGIAATPCVPANAPPGLVYGGTSQCVMGTQPCNGVCSGWVGPSTEICDGIDNDCDGVVDDAPVGVGVACGLNQPPCTPGLTACSNGVLVCQGGSGPQPEVCDGADNDCDSMVDESPLADGPPAGMNGCWNDPVGPCNPTCTFENLAWCPPPGGTCNDIGTLTAPCNKGVLVCAGGAGWVCQGPKGPSAEACDGLDNNCNGVIDDGVFPGVGAVCGTDVGACQTGLIACSAGVLDCVGDVGPTPEICDGLDNDCNGVIDNGVPLGGACTPPYDMLLYPGDRNHPPCQPGQEKCINGVLICEGGVGPSPEVCDGLDNDCDTVVDEPGAPPDGLDGTENPVPPPSAAIGDNCLAENACTEGAWVCKNGLFACVGGQAPQPEACDCNDNDCDGTIDEQDPNAPLVCSAGKDCVKSASGCQCAAPCRSGEFECPAGQTCERVTSSETGETLGGYCVVDACPGGCDDKTTTDGSQNVICAPLGTQLPNCVEPPVCKCKGPSGCNLPCLGVTCGVGTVCTDYGPNAGTCVADNDCFNVPCQGCDLVCNFDPVTTVGVCIDSPCEPNPCAADEVCKPTIDFSDYECVGSCAGVDCDAGTKCEGGECVPTCDPPCADGTACDHSQTPPKCVADLCPNAICANGACCNPLDGLCGNCPCEGVVCPTDQMCQEGQCIEAPQTTGTSSSSGSGGGTGVGGSSTTATGPGGSSDERPGAFGLATGGGACACEVGPGTDNRAKHLAWAALALALAAIGRRKRKARGAAVVVNVRGLRPPTPPNQSSRLTSLRSANLELPGALLVVAAGSALTLLGCDTEAYCFRDCEGQDTPSTSGTGNTGGDLFPGTGGSGGCADGFCETGGGAPCTPTADPAEVCDELDNDCDGKIDNLPAAELASPAACGTCATNCFAALTNCDIAGGGVTCEPSPDPGTEPGTCVCTACAQDYYTIDEADPCGYYCIPDDTTPESECNNKDDDCDGVKDEGVDFCNSLTDCGYCGHNCSLPHATSDCVHVGNPPCDSSNAKCEIATCECTGAGNCWWDIDLSAITGCEYQCDTTNNGIEVCGDSIDNDCDGKIDEADDLAGDPQIGVPCFGDPDGVCASAAHQGATICLGNKVTCGGANILHENDQLESCNGLDDDCDGTVDDSPTDVGGPCGNFNIFPCSFGLSVCTAGVKTCVGAVNPTPETCDGEDDDCDGFVDKTGAVPPPDAVGACDVPIPPPANATSACKAGGKACVGGTVVCQGSIKPGDSGTSPADTCGVDANCDGTLTNQPNLQTDASNCGSCANDCYLGAVHAIWGCSAGTCQFQGCENGYYDLNNDNKCEYACVFVSSAETCNGIDDNCNGTIDENVVAPGPAQVCGVSPSATAAECTSGVAVACQSGKWNCTFPANVCSPNCATAVEVCDAVDNNCNGQVNENVANYAKPCASDDGLAPPGHGACKTTGTFVCNGPSATVCSATKANCSTLPGGCTEQCDGVDNDCDSLVDEPYANKGTNAQNFVKPTVTRLATSLWIYSYESSRPSATNAAPGSGNGYWTSAPSGETIDKTAACSVPTKIPWFNVSPQEAEQTCQAMGGSLCSTADWQTACRATVNCTWGYNPRGAACTSTYNAANKYCNIGPSFDFDLGAAGDQDGLLPTASPELQNCWADWSTLQGNTAATAKIFDITGNLREITKEGANVYHPMGGAFNTQTDAGATCNFTFYTVDQTFKFFDAGFRCCFTTDPTL